MSDLRARAAQAAVVTDENGRATRDIAAGEFITAQTAGNSEPLPEVTYTDPIEDVDQVPVHVAWIRVMRDVKSIDKRSTANIKTEKGSYSFNYRGIDKVLNAVGPALRRHGVTIVPTAIETTYGNAGRMRECLVRVTYRVIGPDGNHFEMMGVGEGLDSGERATPKALTTAYRNMLITALTIPTEDPKMDPDVVDIQREAPRPPTAEEYYRMITNPNVSVPRLRQIRGELGAHPDIAQTMVDNGAGEQVTMLKLLTTIGAERAKAEG